MQTKINLAVEFPLNPGLIYLNHAAVSPWPLRTANAVKQFTDENLHTGSSHYLEWLKVEQRLRERLSWLISAPSSDDISLVKNTSEALSIIAYGLDWKSGDNVVITNQEFPSNRIVWQSLARFGVECREVDISGDDPEKALISAMDHRTRMLAVSSVQYATGLRLDCVQLGSACREREVLYCIDAIQSLGVAPLSAQATQADVICADGHKWMLGPEGLALLYVRESLRDRLNLNQFGWHMVEAIGDFDRHEWQPATTARRFEPGSPNMLAIHALDASLSLFEQVGLDAVYHGVENRVSLLAESILELASNYELISPRESKRRAGILTFRPLTEDVLALHQRLTAEGVQCAIRAGGIRLSPHFYTPIETLVGVIRLLQPAT